MPADLHRVRDDSARDLLVARIVFSGVEVLLSRRRTAFDRLLHANKMFAEGFTRVEKGLHYP